MTRYFAKMHDRRPEQVQHYEEFMTTDTGFWSPPGVGDTPELKVLQDAHFAVWEPPGVDGTMASAWNAGGFVEGSGWVKPKDTNSAITDLGGHDYVAFTSWFPANYGHFGKFKALLLVRFEIRFDMIA